jgi:hypothetical protein
VVSTAVFAGCEAFTAGIGSIGCAAVAGAAGALVEQGFKCADKGGDDCSAGAFAGSAVEGAITGAVGGALGELGGKILAKAAPKALEVAGGLFGKGATEAGESAGADATDGAAAAAKSEEAGTNAQSHSDEAPAEDGPTGCPETHSFTGSTQVLMADGTTRAIDQIKVGDTIANSVPGAKGTEAHKVTAVIVTHTDHDFVDVTIRKTGEASGKHSVKAGVKAVAKKAARKAAFGLAASAAILGALSAGHGHTPQSATAPVAAVSKTSSAPVAKTGAEVKAAHLTTTFHHPFYDETQSAFVDAKDLKPGDVLQTPTGTAQVTGVRLYHANTTTYDLTIGTLHTYYVEAGSTLVLVHNISLPCPEALESGLAKAKAAHSRFKQPGGMSGYTELDNGVSSNLSSGKTPEGFGRNLRPDWEAPPGTTDENFHHLENQTAALMRKTGAKEGYLYLHKAEGAAYGACQYCEPAMRDMLPQGSKLMIIWRNSRGVIENRVFNGHPL